MLLFLSKVFTRFTSIFDTEQYYEKSCESYQKITVITFFLSKVAGCDLTEKRTLTKFLSSEYFVKFFRSVLL